MRYPDDFNTPAFPAGKSVAMSRIVAVMVMVSFVLIMCVCGVIVWAKKTQNTSPFLISINPNGERWTLVAHDNHKNEIPAYFVLQESLLNKFARHWFSISDNVLENTAIWSDACSRDSDECRLGNGGDTCAIYCESNDKVFDTFQKNVLPVYEQLETNESVVWNVVNVVARPVDFRKISANGGMWKLNVLVNTGVENIVFSGYANLGHDQTEYPKTMGYYISDFNMFRMN